jgi:RNA polymerase sigma factor (sigma-70 family)
MQDHSGGGIITKEQAVKWVRDNRPIIFKKIRSYTACTPYDRDDFLQDAHIAALQALEISKKKNILFETCFWYQFLPMLRSSALDFTDNDQNKNRGNASTSPTTLMCIDIENVNPNFPDRKDSPFTDQIDPDLFFNKISKHIPLRQRKIIKLLIGCGVHGKHKIREIAKILNISESYVRKDINTTILILKQKVQSGVICIDIDNVKYNEFYIQIAFINHNHIKEQNIIIDDVDSSEIYMEIA